MIVPLWFQCFLRHYREQLTHRLMDAVDISYRIDSPCAKGFTYKVTDSRLIISSWD